jgi:hypothetical protein
VWRETRQLSGPPISGPITLRRNAYQCQIGRNAHSDWHVTTMVLNTPMPMLTNEAAAICNRRGRTESVATHNRLSPTGTIGIYNSNQRPLQFGLRSMPETVLTRNHGRDFGTTAEGGRIIQCAALLQRWNHTRRSA